MRGENLTLLNFLAKNDAHLGNFLDKDMKRENLAKILGRNSYIWAYAETGSWTYAETGS